MPLYTIKIEEPDGAKIAGHTHLSGAVNSAQILACGLGFADYSDKYDVQNIINEALVARTTEKVYIGYSRRGRWNAITRKKEYSLHPVLIQRFSEIATYSEGYKDDI